RFLGKTFLEQLCASGSVRQSRTRVHFFLIFTSPALSAGTPSHPVVSSRDQPSPFNGRAERSDGAGTRARMRIPVGLRSSQAPSVTVSTPQASTNRIVGYTVLLESMPTTLLGS